MSILIFTQAPSAAATPAAPTQLRGTALAAESVRLRWQDNACTETAYIVQIEVDGAWRQVPYALHADTSAVILSGLEPSTAYRFRLTAANSEGISDFSEAAEVRTFAAAPACIVTEHRLCLMGGRYAVSATFEAAHFTGARYAAHAVPDGARTGSFWFFDANNLEVSVEITDGSEINGHVWVSTGGLSNLEYRIRVIDTLTGESRVYVNPTDTLCGIDDREAFLTPSSQTAPAPESSLTPASLAKPAAAKDSPTRRDWPRFEKDSFRAGWAPTKLACGFQNDADLRLLGGRFELSVEWRDTDGAMRSASPRYDSDNSGFFIVDEPDLADWAVKILDGRFFNQHYWLFWTPLSGRESWLRVKDTQTGAERRMYSARGTSCGRADTSAFEAPADEFP